MSPYAEFGSQQQQKRVTDVDRPIQYQRNNKNIWSPGIRRKSIEVRLEQATSSDTTFSTHDHLFSQWGQFHRMHT